MTWLHANWAVLARFVSILGLYALVKWFPGLEAERETLLALTEALGLGVAALTPGLRAAKRANDPPNGGPP